jgi:hypothetical protein
MKTNVLGVVIIHVIILIHLIKGEETQLSEP